MIICIIVCIIAVALLVLGIVGLNVRKSSWSSVFPEFFTAVGCWLIAVCGVVLLFTRIPKAVEVEVENALIEREALVYRLDNKEELGVGDELLYRDIVAFNKEVNTYKMYRESVWTSWFVAPELAEIEPIEWRENEGK